MPRSNIASTKMKRMQLLLMCGVLMKFNGDTWNTKKEQGISLNQPVAGLEIPEGLAEFTAILTRMHHLE